MSKLRRAAFGHWQDQGCIASGKQTLVILRPTQPQGLGQINAAMKLFRAHCGVKPHNWGQQFGGIRHEAIPHRPAAGAQRDATQADRVNGQQAKRGLTPLPRGHQAPNTSSTMRFTRVPEPASSKGSRRSRWRSARGAISRIWDRVSAVSSRNAA